MHILIVHNSIIPAAYYGGTERVVWALGKELVKMGHQVSYLVQKGSSCPFAKVYNINPLQPLVKQLPEKVDVVHFNNVSPEEPIKIPYIVTMHGNRNDYVKMDLNTVFVSSNHAIRYGSQSFVYNGLDWDTYGKPNWSVRRQYIHFLGHAAWRVKNVKGAIKVVTSIPHERLYVMGGYRLNFKMGFRLTLHPRVRFLGMVGGDKKISLLNGSKGLVFPVRWHEPFGLALTESLYFGCPVLGTPYGSLPEIVHSDVGYLSANSTELMRGLKDIGQYSSKRCHEYARDCFDAATMAEAYLSKYAVVLNNKTLNCIPPVWQGGQDSKFLPWK